MIINSSSSSSSNSSSSSSTTTTTTTTSTTTITFMLLDLINLLLSSLLNEASDFLAWRPWLLPRGVRSFEMYGVRPSLSASLHAPAPADVFIIIV